MTVEALPRPLYRSTRWARQNLFSNFWNGLLTVVVGLSTVWMITALLRWGLTQARWEVVLVNSKLYMVGRYPGAEVWRVWVALAMVAVLSGITWGRIAGPMRRPNSIKEWWVWSLAGIGLVAALLYATALETRAMILLTTALVLGGRQIGPRTRRMSGRNLSMAWLASYLFILWFLGSLGPVSPQVWGGFMLTMLLTVNGIAISFPFGVLLALGRASSFPAIRWLSTAFIELIRGVPLVTILFMAFLLFPLLVPPHIRLSIFLRAQVGLIIFTAAYVAENVRGGLQSIPRGQIEAAQAVGLSPWQTTRLIVLPQALRVVIPALVGQFISLFKDTSLVIVVGLLELLAVAEAVTSQPAFRGLQREALVFAALLYWVVAYSMSRWSQRLEKRLGLGER